ncbi:MAG: FAD-binding protein, partial [Pyrinomonadaceae bacterium]|nr:FAD-binding protein [Pyrinomonadaceae bacterium]
MTKLDEKYLSHRFPNIYETCKHYGLNIATDLLPISPAVHYFMGGVRTNLNGETTVKNLFAAGEVASTGVQGANRLASNSLLEGLVFGARAGKQAVESPKSKVQSPKSESQNSQTQTSKSDIEISVAVRKRVKRLMWERVGISRDAANLKRALREFEQIASADLSTASRSFVTLATLIAKAALWREESRGGHFRTDFPQREDNFQVHSIQKLGAEIQTSETINFADESNQKAA